MLNIATSTAHTLKVPVPPLQEAPAPGLPAEIDAAFGRPQTLARGGHLFRCGERRDAVFLLLDGSVKVYRVTEAGEEQVMGFEFAGALFGLDVFGSATAENAAVALEHSRVRRLDLAALRARCRESATLQHLVFQAASRRISELQDGMLRLGRMHAAARLAAFVLDVAARRGGAPEFQLSMTREAIGAYLGMALETVSRLLQRFADDGLISVQGRRIRLLRPDQLHRLEDGAAT